MTDEATTQTDEAGNPILVDMADKPLSNRQNVVYHMHKSGMSNVDIASTLGIAAGTVSNALVTALTRMGERNGTKTGDMDVPQYVAHRYTIARDTITQAQNDLTQAMHDIATVRALAIATNVELDDATLGTVDIDMSMTRTEVVTPDASDGDTGTDPSDADDDTDGASNA